MSGGPAARRGAVTLTAALLGDVFAGKEPVTWFRGLKSPRWQLPMPGFAVAAAYYVIIGVVMAAVLAGNEAWNVLVFGRRSPRAASVGLLAFLVPPGGLQRSVWPDTRSRWLALAYTAYVILYDVPWAYRLWQLNPSRVRDRHITTLGQPDLPIASSPAGRAP